MKRTLIVLSVLPLVALLHLLLAPASSPLLSADQRGMVLEKRGRHLEAANLFSSTEWRAAALYQVGEFKQVVALLSGYETAEALYNTGNALAFQGLYAEAVPMYERALSAKPSWEDAQVNLEVARQGAARTKREGGEQTSEIGADEIVFDKRDPSKGTDTEAAEGGAELGEAELRALWLRNVETRPSDFLRTKFAYQAAVGVGEPEEARREN